MEGISRVIVILRKTFKVQKKRVKSTYHEVHHDFMTGFYDCFEILSGLYQELSENWSASNRRVLSKLTATIRSTHVF